MDLAPALRLAFQLAIFATVFATGLATTTRDLSYLGRHPGLLVRTLLATVVISPIVALVLWRLLPIGAPAAIAIIAGALAPGLPTVPRTGGTVGGNVAFATSSMFVTTLLCVVTVPLWLALLHRFAGIDAQVAPSAIARILVVALLLPLLSGVAIRRLAPLSAARIARPVGTLANAVLPGLALVVVLVGLQALLDLGWAALLAMVIAPLIALAIGHALGGPEPRDRTVLAIANATRFPALAAVIATSAYPEVRALPAVIAYAVLAIGVTIPYQLARRRAHRRATGEREPSSAPRSSGTPHAAIP